MDILPSEGDEEEKTFTVTLRSASNDVEIDPDRQTASITIRERGMPYGVIGFFGDVLQPFKVDEGEGNQTVLLPIARTTPALGDVLVNFVVTGMQSMWIYITLLVAYTCGCSMSMTILCNCVGTDYTCIRVLNRRRKE